MVFRYSSSESQEMGLSVFVFGKPGNGLPVFLAYSTWKNEMDLRCLSLGNEETKGNAGRLDDEFETNRFWTMMETTGSGHVRMMETTGSGRLDNGNRNEPKRQTFDDGVRNKPECRMKLRPGLW
ncbi:uncharacterized protein OCT59_002281 [Rhizophagus irregularis]|uniref:uncharacterized protein n=1 Tax=Rhizophagus irregularis TaxID=588596 RepID=UPI003316FC20|nr:hypothetical protein OCT59_002281 [Rhizophagus irregularis]